MAGGQETDGIQRSRVDGVPCFSADAPEPYTGALIFRVGRADEDLRSSGITHLVEHLAIHPFESLPHSFGGLIDDTRTVFHASGTREEVASYLSGICRNLRSLSAERVADERRVLRAESGDAVSPHPLWALRFGPNAYGLVGFPEYGLHWLEGQDLQGWADERFTRQNCAVWFSGDPPQDLNLELPSGDSIRPPEPVTLAGLELPSWVAAAGDGASLSMLAPRSTTMNAATTMLAERLQEHLRRELGLTYSAGSNYWRLNATRAHVLVLADSAPGHGKAVRDGLLRVLDEFAERGPSAAALERHVALSDRYGDDPRGVPFLLDTHASDHLAGTRTPARSAIVEETNAMTPASVAAEVAGALESAIYLVPSGLGLDSSRAAKYRPAPAVPPVEGEEIGSSDSGPNALRITLGETGVTHRSGGEELTIPYEDCPLAAVDHEYALTMFNSAGESIWFRYKGENFRRQVREAITAGMPAERIVQLDPEVRSRHDEIEALAQRQLSDPDSWGVAVLARTLFEGERVLNLADATYSEASGLLVLTDLRLLLIDALGERFIVELPRERVTSAQVTKRRLKRRLEIVGDGDQLVFGSISPGARAGEIADELSPAGEAG